MGSFDQISQAFKPKEQRAADLADKWFPRLTGYAKTVRMSNASEIMGALSPQEKEIANYHRNILATGQAGTDERGRPVTVYSNTIQIPEGPHAGKFVTIPGYFDKSIHDDERVLWDKWGHDINAGKWPLYDDPKIADERAKYIHGIMDSDMVLPPHVAGMYDRDTQSVIINSDARQSMNEVQLAGLIALERARGLLYSPLGEQFTKNFDLTPDQYDYWNNYYLGPGVDAPKDRTKREDILKSTILSRMLVGDQLPQGAPQLTPMQAALGGLLKSYARSGVGYD